MHVQVEFEEKQNIRLEVESAQENASTIKLQLFSLLEIEPERLVLIDPQSGMEVKDEEDIGDRKLLWAFEGESVADFVINELSMILCLF
jgi:hypothetical protein